MFLPNSEIRTNKAGTLWQHTARVVLCIINSEGSDYLRKKEVSSGPAWEPLGQASFLEFPAYLPLLSLGWASSSFPWNVPCSISQLIKAPSHKFKAAWHVLPLTCLNNSVGSCGCQGYIKIHLHNTLQLLEHSSRRVFILYLLVILQNILVGKITLFYFVFALEVITKPKISGPFQNFRWNIWQTACFQTLSNHLIGLLK